jgi:hypothetical protein
MNFTSNRIDTVLKDVDPQSTMTIQNAATKQIETIQSLLTKKDEPGATNVLNNLLHSTPSQLVLQAIVQSHWRHVPDQVKRAHSSELLNRLLTTGEQSLYTHLLLLIRKDTDSTLNDQNLERIINFFVKETNGFTADGTTAVTQGILTAIQVIHVLSKNYEIAPTNVVEMDNSVDQIPVILRKIVKQLIGPLVKIVLLPVMRNITKLLKRVDDDTFANDCIELARVVGKILFRTTRAYTECSPQILTEVVQCIPKFMNCVLEASRTAYGNNGGIINIWSNENSSIWRLYNRILKILNDVENKNPILLKRHARDILTILRGSVRVPTNVTKWSLPDKTLALSFDNIGNLCADYSILWLTDVCPQLDLFLRTSIFPRLSLSENDKNMWKNNPSM